MHLAPEVRTTLLTLFAALSVASVASISVKKFRPDSDWSELRSRVRTWWVIVALFSLAVYWSSTAVVVFFALVSYLALKEFLSMTPTRRADRRVLFYAYLSIVAQYAFAGMTWYGAFIMFIPVVMFVWIPTRMILIGHTEGFLRAAGSLHWALMLTVFSLSHAAYLFVLLPGDSPRVAPVHRIAESNLITGHHAIGPGLLVFLVLVTELNDIFQFMWGKTMGKRKVAPTVSPGKTYAGLFGGVATTIILAGVIGPRLTVMDLPRSLLAGLMIAVSGFAGDLCFSALKRDLNIKDFGATLPGHGGVLDRIDSLVFTAPLFFHFVFYHYG